MGLKNTLEVCAPAIAKKIKDAPPNVKNVGEYCKLQACWSAVSSLQINLPMDFKNALIEKTEIKQQKKDDIVLKRIDNEIEFEEYLLGLFPHLGEIKSFAYANKLSSPKSNDALTKLTAGKINLNFAEKDALKKLFANMKEEGYEFP